MRVDGYAPIEDYGAIDWPCLPNLDSPSAFAAILDAGRGGSFTLQPTIPFRSPRRYLPRTNVLENHFRDRSGIRARRRNTPRVAAASTSQRDVLYHVTRV